MKEKIFSYSLDHPKRVFIVMLIFVLALGAMIPRITIDTDPENMLSVDQADRVLHNQIKKQFNLYDMIVVGVVNETDAKGIFNKDTLSSIHTLVQEIKKIEGVIQQDIMSLATVDNITPEGPGSIRFQWMMNEAPTSQAIADEISQSVKRLPLLDNTIVSADGRAAGIYVPIKEKHESYRVANEIRSVISTLSSTDEFHITGLPVAEDTFGVEMFKQMAISAPAAGLVIFMLMWFFFRSVALITAPMIMALATVIATMGLLIGTGHTVHIMSSMIPIFLMPIAVVDSVHLLSEFADRYRPGDDPKQLVREIMGHLFTPMFYTSITSSIGFMSLAFTPIPPVQVFGMFVAIGIFLAFLLTVTFIPAYIVCLSPARLDKLVRTAHNEDDHGPLAITLRKMGGASLRYSKLILLLFAMVFAASIFGIAEIEINDNPVRWFEEQHEIRVADRVLNKHFAGTYNAFLVLTKEENGSDRDRFYKSSNEIISNAEDKGVDLKMLWSALVQEHHSEIFSDELQNLSFSIDDTLFDAKEPAVRYWEQLLKLAETYAVNSKYFQTPAALNATSKLQQALIESGYVGKSNGLPDLVKTVYRELLSANDDDFRIPDTSEAVAQTILSFQGSHKPNDLWHMVTPDYNSTAIWLQLKSGDNQDTQKLIAFVNQYLEKNPLPGDVSVKWGGLTYINVIWQEAMVNGMLNSLMSAFVVVAIIMIILFRSLLFGLLAMIPLSITITLIYGVIGFIGKDYDMPVAVLSALTLGLSVDFAIHFLERIRSLHKKHKNWEQAIAEMFEEPGRAISRNAIVIALGFTPLLLSPLKPYQTVGVFLASIMVISCLVTLIVLPAIMQQKPEWFFKKYE